MTAPARTQPRQLAPAGPLPAGLVWLVPALLVATVAGLLVTGAAAPTVLGDSGALVRWGLPVVRAARDLSLAGAIGALLLAASVLAPSTPAWDRSVRAAAACSVLWTVTSVVVLVLGYADTAGRPLGGVGFGQELGYFVTQLDLGRILLLAAALAALTSIVAMGVRGPGGALLALGLAAVALVPLALTGHAAGAASHELAVSGWWLHLIGVSAWMGGLAALALVAPLLGSALSTAARRYSTIAGAAYAVVVISGVVSAWIRLNGFGDLLHGYGLLVLAKAVATVLLGVAGYRHRQAMLSRLDAAAGARAFWRLVSGELVLMGVTMGLGVALGRSPTPVPNAPPPDPTPAQRLTGEPLPPPLTGLRWLTETRPEILWLLVALGLAACYLIGVRKLRARGDSWPVHRSLLWLLGCLVLVYLTSGAPAAYGRTLFSIHMVQHMALSMVVPPLLVAGAPITLLMRATKRRRDGSRGLREWVLVLVESRWGRFVSHPVVAAAIFAGSIIVFYFSPLFEAALSTHVGHELMTIHFLLAGYLFANALIGVDPGPNRPGYPMRLVLLLATMGFHAFFGVAVMSSEALLAADWFSSTGWGIDALADQRDGGAIAWGIGEFPTLVLALVVAVQWSRSDAREARRTDRAADRDHDAQLTAYNAMLSDLAERDKQSR